MLRRPGDVRREPRRVLQAWRRLTEPERRATPLGARADLQGVCPSSERNRVRNPDVGQCSEPSPERRYRADDYVTLGIRPVLVEGSPPGTRAHALPLLPADAA